MECQITINCTFNQLHLNIDLGDTFLHHIYEQQASTLPTLLVTNFHNIIGRMELLGSNYLRGVSLARLSVRLINIEYSCHNFLRDKLGYSVLWSLDLCYEVLGHFFFDSWHTRIERAFQELPNFFECFVLWLVKCQYRITDLPGRMRRKRFETLRLVVLTCYLHLDFIVLFHVWRVQKDCNGLQVNPRQLRA